MLPDDLIAAHRARALTPDHPVIRGTAQNPDTFFQAREACTPFYDRCPGIVQDVMDEFAVRTGRRYRLFDYVGDPDADRVVVVMGSAAETAHETVDWLRARGERVGVLKVRLYRPFSAADLLAALPASTRAVAVLDRTKEPGALGEPLYQDVVTAFAESRPGRSRPADRRRRPLRPVVQGVHAGDARGRVRRTVPAVAAQTLHRRHRRRRQPLLAGLGPRPRHRAGRRCRAASSSAWARTARSAPTRTRSRSSARRRRASRRATSSTTRRSPARSPSRTCVSARRRSGRHI